MAETPSATHFFSTTTNQPTTPTRARAKQRNTLRRTMAVVVPASADVRSRASSATQTLWRNASKRVSRTKEILRQSIGKADKTDDTTFEDYVDNFNRGSQRVTKLHKQLENYVQSLRAMNSASTALFGVFKECYEDDFEGQLSAIDSIDSIMASTKELIKEVDKSINHVVAFKSQFPTVKTKIEKRNKKLLDFDGWRHEIVAIQSSKKKLNLEKLAKAEEQASESKRLYESLNYELYDSLPEIHDQRISVFTKTFNSVFKGEANFHQKSTTLAQSLIETLSNLEDSAAAGTYATPRLTAPVLTLPDRMEPPPRKPKPDAASAAAAAAAATGSNSVDADQNNNNSFNGDVTNTSLEEADDVFEVSTAATTSEAAGETSEAETMTTAVAKTEVDGAAAAAASDAGAAAAAASDAVSASASDGGGASAAAADTAAAAAETAPMANGAVDTRVVTHKYEGTDEDELSLDVGQVVNVLKLEVCD